jgi:hypothetical protein
MAIVASEALASLGFTGLESEIYAFLLKESPSTGYRVAQGIGKPVANTYKAIQSLEAKGAITVDEEASRMCHAIPVDDLLGRLARDFESRKAQALEALSSLGGKREGDRILPLKTRDAVLQQAIDLIASAQHRVSGVYATSFSGALSGSIDQAAGRGVVVTIQATGSQPSTGPGSLHGKWPGEVVVLTADGQQCLFALIDRWGNVVQAGWSRGAFLSLLLHEGLAAEICLAEVNEKIEEGAGAKRIGRALASFDSATETAGFKALTEELI